MNTQDTTATSQTGEHPATEQIVTALLEDETQLRRLLHELVQTGAYLSAKAEWSMEDNFTTTEWVCAEFGVLVPTDKTLDVILESTYTLREEQMEEHLIPHLGEQP